jgi:hypothetical protein
VATPSRPANSNAPRFLFDLVRRPPFPDAYEWFKASAFLFVIVETNASIQAFYIDARQSLQELYGAVFGDAARGQLVILTTNQEIPLSPAPINSHIKEDQCILRVGGPLPRNR